MKKILMLTLLASSVVAACAPSTRFEWANYESGLYAYHTNPEHRGRYRESIEAAIERGEATDRVAPGLHAELGYLYWEDGDRETARQHFSEEMSLFPESRLFLGRYMSGAEAQADQNNKNEPTVSGAEVM